MSHRKVFRSEKDRLVAKVIEESKDEKGACAFCHTDQNDEVVFGKMYSIGDLYCHYFCVLLSCCLVQKGRDSEGLLGFLYTDIVAEVERSKKHKCSYCLTGGATLGCAVAQCRKQFHVPCGQRRGAVSLFFGNYKSFCEKHAPQQKIESSIMKKAQARLTAHRKKIRMQRSLAQKCPDQNSPIQSCPEQSGADQSCPDQSGLAQSNLAPNCAQNSLDVSNLDVSTGTTAGNMDLNGSGDLCDTEAADPEALCALCYEAVSRWAGSRTFWPPCCARDAWLHRACLQRMALSAGMHYLKCPLCNDKQQFHAALVAQGYYVPDRDAAWELEQNAFAEIYERPMNCDVEECKCPSGRRHDAETGEWDIQLCLLCGSSGAHRGCGGGGSGGGGGAGGGQRYVCSSCRATASGEDWRRLEDALEAMAAQEAAAARPPAPHAPRMPPRMSVRRTKGRLYSPVGAGTPGAEAPEKGRQERDSRSTGNDENEKTTQSSRLELNLKSPRLIKSQQPIQNPIQQSIQSQDVKQSPMKLLENELYEKISGMGNTTLDVKQVIEGLRLRLTKPQPLSVKKKIVNGILDDIFNKKTPKETKSKATVRAWSSPKKENCDKTHLQNTKETVRPNASKKKTNKPKRKSLSLNKDRRKSTTKRATCLKEEVNKSTKLDNEQVSNDDFDKTLTENNDKNSVESENDKDSKKNDAVDEKVEKKDVIDKEVEETKPKKSTKVDIELNSSFEISENEESIKIDLVKIESVENSDVIKDLEIQLPEKKLCVKFSPKDKEVLQDSVNVLDVESFKNQYLNEIERDCKSHNNAGDKGTCFFKHNHETKEESKKNLRTAIDFAMQVASKKVTEVTKKKKKNKKKKSKSQSPKIKLVYFNTNETSLATKKKLKKNKRNRLKMNNDSDLSVEIKWREQELKIKINNSDRKELKRKREESKTMKQTVLQFSPEASEKKEFASPENDATPKKSKKIKLDKCQDNFKQMSIQSFFKVASPNTNE